MSSRWSESDVPRGARYDERFRSLAASGMNVHGEADLVQSLLPRPDGRVLDAGCGTGRVAVELAQRGVSVTGVDLDPAMLAEARRKAPQLHWIEGDLADATLDLGGPYDIIVAAGNVMIFLAPGTEGQVVSTLAAALNSGGLLVAGFQLGAGRLSLSTYDQACTAAALSPVNRWATWDRQPYVGNDYAVSVHARGATSAPDRDRR